MKEEELRVQEQNLETQKKADELKIKENQLEMKERDLREQELRRREMELNKREMQLKIKELQLNKKALEQSDDTSEPMVLPKVEAKPVVIAAEAATPSTDSSDSNGLIQNNNEKEQSEKFEDGSKKQIEQAIDRVKQIKELIHDAINSDLTKDLQKLKKEQQLIKQIQNEKINVAAPVVEEQKTDDKQLKSDLTSVITAEFKVAEALKEAPVQNTTSSTLVDKLENNVVQEIKQDSAEKKPNQATKEKEMDTKEA